MGVGFRLVISEVPRERRPRNGCIHRIPATARLHNVPVIKHPVTRVYNAKGRGIHTDSAANSVCPDYSRLPIGPAHGLVSSGSRADWIGTSGQCLAGSVFGLNGNFSARIFS